MDLGMYPGCIQRSTPSPFHPDPFSSACVNIRFCGDFRTLWYACPVRAQATKLYSDQSHPSDMAPEALKQADYDNQVRLVCSVC